MSVTSQLDRGEPAAMTDGALSFAALRLAAGLSQQDAADWLDVRPDTIKNWSSGKRAVPLPVMLQLSELVRRQEAGAAELAPALRDLADAERRLLRSDEEAQGAGWKLAVAFNVMVMRAWAMAAGASH